MNNNLLKNKIIIVAVTTIIIVTAAIFLLKPLSKTTDIPLITKILQPRNVEFIPNQKVEIPSTVAYRQHDTIYQHFRQHFRLHYQTIGVATFPDSSRILLLSEPAPYFEIDSIRSVCAKFTHQVITKSHKIGFDGHVTDVLILLANASNENVNNLTKALCKQLYLSDYKPIITSLPIKNKRQYFATSSLDYQISLFEFNEWFLEQDELFVAAADTSHSYTIEQIFTHKRRGVYFSKLPGFVAWAVAKNQDISEQQSQIRQFTLDADLILGALSDSATLVIIGRERESPLYELPPLHVESILLLAAISQKELSQSLDVNDFMAGKMSNGSDWCPTYLSPELENTEFGHLLTITDILLKDWSENGTIQEAYYRYPSPPHFPFNRPLFKKLGINELVYNWNTNHAMYAIDMDSGITIYTLNRTGALPVSYFNSPERSVSVGREYEKQAYQYFATLGNTDLARVVQYTALYQLFIDNNIIFSGNTHAAPPTNKPYLLQKPTKELLTFFKNINNKQIDWLADTLAKKNFSDYVKENITKQLRQNEQRYHFTYTEAQATEIYDKVATDLRNNLHRDIQNATRMLNNLTDTDFDLLSKYLSYPRGMQASGRATRKVIQQARRMNDLLRVIGKHNLRIIGLDLQQVRNFYVGNLRNATARYLKTPSVIVTYNDFLTTGGHNLSAGITRVNSLAGYKRGYVKPAVAPEQQPKSAPKVGQKSGKVNGVVSQPSKAGKTVSSARTAPTIRPRGAVISTSARPHRGL